MKSILLIFFLSSTACLGQVRIDFNVASPNVDTIGWWIAFKDSISQTSSYTIDLQERDDYPILVEKMARNYYGDVDFKSGGHKTTQAIGNSEYPGVLPVGFVFRYAAVMPNQVIVRLEHITKGDFEVLCFKNNSAGWTHQSNPKTNLYSYMTLFSFALHTQKSAVVAQRPGVIRTLQSECADFIHPFFVQVDCVVDLIERNNLMKNPEFIEGLKKIDNRTYGKL